MPPKVFEPGAEVWVRYDGKSYRGRVLGDAKVPVGAYRVLRFFKDGETTVETVDPLFIHGVAKEQTHHEDSTEQ